MTSLIILAPAVALLIGAMLALTWPPGPKVTSGIHHFTAGVVFAAAGSEILPEVMHQQRLVATLIGAGVGLVSMLAIKTFTSRSKGAWGLLAATGVDIFIDGLVLGIALAAGQRTGLLLGIALVMEVLFLGVAVVLELRQSAFSRVRVLLTALALGLLVPLGSLAGLPAAQLGEPYLTAFLSFGLVALLFLVTEELLVEAHVVEETPLVASMFFIGFFGLVAVEELLPR